jgi:hypothetical protein
MKASSLLLIGILGIHVPWLDSGPGSPSRFVTEIFTAAGASVSANKSYNVFFNKIKTRNVQNLNPIRLLISSPGGFMDFGVFFNGAAATFD